MKLTEKQRRFVEAYMGDAKRNASPYHLPLSGSRSRTPSCSQAEGRREMFEKWRS